jgi:hypothetical protein
VRAAVIVAVALLARGAHAGGGGDYRADSRDWNGLGRLVDEAREVGCTVAAGDVLDWGALGARDSLWLVYPRTTVDAVRLRRYLEAGGRALIADDFGASDAALASLQIRRLRSELTGADRYQDNPALPIARQTLTTELSAGVPAIVANHPAFLSAAMPATYSFVPGAALVVEGRLGKGYFVALADPSVLINNMLEIDDDLQFTRALIRRTCKAGDRIVLVSQSFLARGDPAGELSSDGDSAFDHFNRMLGSIDDAAHAFATDARLLAVLAIVAALIVLAVVARAWPGRQPIEGEWTRGPAPPESGWQALVDRYASAAVPWGWALPAAALRDEVVTRLSESLGAAVADWKPTDIQRRVGAKHGPRAAASAAALWKQMGRLGWRGPSPPPVEPPWVTRRQLARLHALAQTLFDEIAAHGQGND